MKISAKTDIGRVRRSNQDAYASGEFDKRIAWAVVCDGMGGASAGNVASETAVNVISEKLNSGYHQGISDNSMKNLLVSAVEAANAKIYSMAERNDEYDGMGTTVVLAVIKDTSLYFAHVGDSRIYLVSKDSITQMTRDHSFVQMMLEKGEITASEAQNHPKKNIITRALGIGSEVRIDYFQDDFNGGDIVLLCSDGLTNYVKPKQIKEICDSTDKYKIADVLVELANNYGGGDNITVVTVSE